MTYHITAANLIARVQQDNEQLIAFRRGNEVLTEQYVRIERRGNNQPREADSAGASQIVAQAVVLGAVDLDVEVGDEFNDSSGTLYKVIFVRPNRQVSTQAIAEVAQ